MNEDLPILVEVRRGGIVEARHRGALVVADPEGRVLARLGNDGLITSTRSTIKPIQAIPLITSGAADRFHFSPLELAVVCASHNGEPIHVETVAGMLSRIGLDERALRCGAHRPFSEAAAMDWEREGRPFTQLHNNCSGKHTGMLASAVQRGLPTEDYLAGHHPVQREIMVMLARLASLDQPLPAAIDGCSAPTFGVPLRALALAFARLAGRWDSELAMVSRRLVAAMTAHPEMVGGTKGRLDSDLIRVARGGLIGKVGAEAVYSIGVLPCARFAQGLGIAIKIEDGAYRALGPVVIETLAQMGLLDEYQQAKLAVYHRPAVETRRGVAVGEVRAVFQLPQIG